MKTLKSYNVTYEVGATNRQAKITFKVKVLATDRVEANKIAKTKALNDPLFRKLYLTVKESVIEGQNLTQTYRPTKQIN